MFDFIKRLPVLVRIPLRYGVIGGVLGFVLVVVLYYIDRHPFMIKVIFDFRVALFAVFLFFVLRELRDYHFGGLLFFWQGLIASWLFVLTYAIIASSLIWLFALNVPEFVRQYIELATNLVKGYSKEDIAQMGTEAYEKSLALLPSTTGFSLAMLYLVQCLIIGLFISIIISVILRRQPTNQN